MHCVLLGHSPADLSGSIGINKLASGFERRCGLLARARAESLWSRVVPTSRCWCQVEILSRQTARRGGASGPIIFTDGFDECRNGGRKRAARDGDERDLPNHLGLRDESMSNAWVNRREFGQEADSHSGGDHSHDPILPLAAMGAPDLHPTPIAKLTQIISVFAVNA